MFLQYVIPIACLIGAAISAFKRHERKQLHLEVAKSPSRNSLESMSWSQFERLVGEVFRRKGFTVEERGGNGHLIHTLRELMRPPEPEKKRPIGFVSGEVKPTKGS